MNIFAPCVVELTWTLSDTTGQELDVLDEPVEFLVGGHDLLHKIEHALMGHEAGSKLDLHLEPEEAFGDYDENKVFLEARSSFPKEIEEGMTLEGTALPGHLSADAPKDLFYTITEIYPEHVVLDGNHPLAGIALRLHLKVNSVRAATPEEIEKGTLGVGFFTPLGMQDEELEDDEDLDSSQEDGSPTPKLLH
jgi:FKBP-type peptidyl-prolyl cis-trans isomerase SlyD